MFAKMSIVLNLICDHRNTNNDCQVKGKAGILGTILVINICCVFFLVLVIHASKLWTSSAPFLYGRFLCIAATVRLMYRQQKITNGKVVFIYTKKHENLTWHHCVHFIFQFVLISLFSSLTHIHPHPMQYCAVAVLYNTVIWNRLRMTERRFFLSLTSAGKINCCFNKSHWASDILHNTSHLTRLTNNVS